MKIVLASDHGGFELKEAIKEHLINEGYDLNDIGVYDTKSVDYPDYGKRAALMVANKEAEKGIIICGTGIGISIAANKVKGIRCGIGYNDEVSKLIKQHNNCNMIAFGARFMDTKDIIKRVKIFLDTQFEGGRHLVRVETITNYENK